MDRRSGRTLARQGFDRFVAATAVGLLRAAYLITWDLADAEDLVQECLFKVARQSSNKTPLSGAPPAGFNPVACAAASGAANASKTSTGAATDVPVHCLPAGSGSADAGNSGVGLTANTASSGASLKSGG